MVPEILNAWLWRARMSIRSASARAFAGHGYVDPSYRPPRLPFVSVVGPLSLQVEPERENGRTAQAKLSIPGYVVGQPIPATAALPASGALCLRFDGRATVNLVLAGLPVTTFAVASTGPSIADAINNALSNALATHQFVDADGSLLVDATLQAALSQARCRWNPATRQMTIVSDVGTPATNLRSSVEVLATDGDLAPALGLASPALAGEGRQRMHRLPPPRPMTLEMRLDLWAHSQGDIAFMFDGLANAAPTRGRLVLRPALLAADPADGDSEIRLLDRGEPTTLESLVHLEGGDGLTDRAAGVVYVASAGAISDPASSRFTLADAAQITGPVWATPLVPEPLFASQPAPEGFAVALGIVLDAETSEGDSYLLLALTRDDVTVMRVSLGIVSVDVPSDGPQLFGEITAMATLVQGATPGTATTRRRVPLADLQKGGTLHATVTASTGIVAVAWEGEPQRLDDAMVTPGLPTSAPGVPTTGSDMTLVLGGGSSAPFPHPVLVSHVHVLGEPCGPLDPKLRLSVAPASRLRPGDMIALSESADGWRLGETASLALVDHVQGNRVFLTQPIRGSFCRGRALVYQDQCFFFQTSVKRRDDLMNQLYHCGVDYRVSALLEDPTARTTAVLAREINEEISARGTSRAPGGHPGVSVADADAVRGVN
jgi:hypothetical protein